MTDASDAPGPAADVAPVPQAASYSPSAIFQFYPFLDQYLNRPFFCSRIFQHFALGTGNFRPFRSRPRVIDHFALALAALDATPNWSLLAYFNEAVLPLFERVRMQRTAAGHEAGGPPAGPGASDASVKQKRLQEQYRKLYQPLSKAEQAAIEAEMNSFGFTRTKA